MTAVTTHDDRILAVPFWPFCFGTLRMDSEEDPSLESCTPEL